MKIGQYKLANEWMREESATPEEALNTWNEMEAEFKANRAMSQEPRSMDQAALSDDLEPGSLKDELEGKFNPDQETYEEYLRRINLERPFNMNQGGRIGFSEGLTVKQQQKVVEAFPDIEFDFKKYPKFGVKKYLTGKLGKVDDRLTNKDWTKVNRFKKKGFTLEMGKGKTTRGVPYSVEGKRLTKTQQEFIKSNFELPEGVKEWDFTKADQKWGFKPDTTEKKNIQRRMERRLKEKKPWTVAADRGSTKGWMMLQMNRVYENEKAAGKLRPGAKKFTYEPIFDKFGDREIIVGFKDNTKAGGGKTYYGLDKYTKKGAGDWTKHGDWKLNQKLVDIAKRSGNAPNDVIMGLLKDRGFKNLDGKLKLDHLIHFLSGTEGTSSDVLKSAIARHHQSGVGFGSATDDLALTTRTINNKMKGIEKRIANNKILAADIQTLKNNNVYVRSPDGTLYGAGKKTPIGQFKQIESSVAKALETGVDLRGQKFDNKKLLKFFKDVGYRCRKSGGGEETVACYMDDVKKTRADLKSSDVTVRAKALTKQRKALQVASKLPQIGKIVRQGLQAGAAGLSTAFKWTGLGAPIGYAIEGMVEGGIYDYYRKQGYNHDQAFAETFTPGLIAGRPEDVAWYGGAEKLREKELIGDVQQNPKVLQYQKALEDQQRVYDTFAEKERGIKAGRKDITDPASADIQDLYRSKTISDINRIMNPESMASQAYNTAVERQQALDERRKKDYMDKHYNVKEPSPFMQEQKQRDRYKEMGEMFRSYTPEDIQAMYPKLSKQFDAGQYKDLMEFFSDLDKKSYYADNFRMEKAGGGIAGIRRPHAIPPKSGPTPQGLPSMYNRVKRI